MKKFLTILLPIALLASCQPESAIQQPEPTPGVSELTEYVDIFAPVASDETKISFDYDTAMYLHWEGDEQMDVYIKSGNSYSYAGRIPAVEGTLSDDKTGIEFAGQVAKRNNPETDSFVFVYTNSGAAYDWTKQTLNMTAEAAGTDGRKALKSYSPLVFTVDNDVVSLSNKACYIKFTASGLGSNVNVKSLSIYSPDAAVFPKTFDLTTFDYQASNKSKTLSYAFDNLKTDGSGNLTVFLAAPIISSGEKNYQIHIVTEDNQHTISTLSTTGITSASAMSSSKLYKLTRAVFTGATNPATTVGQTQGGNNGASDVVIESIVGQWDKTGYLSNDIYGVLDMGKPENLTVSHNSAINSIQKIYNTYFSGNTDTKIHRGAVEVAGLKDYPEKTGITMSANGPQYVDSYYNEGTFNNIVLTKPTEVYMTFIDSKAWNTNTIGYYCYSGYTDSEGRAYSSAAGHKNVHDLIVFPSTSQNTQDVHLVHRFEDKTTAQMLYPESAGVFKKIFPAGTTIGLMERVNALEQSSDFALKAISNDSPVHYTNIAWNQLNTREYTPWYWNQIAVLKFKMPEDTDFNRHGLIYAMKDKYEAHGTNGEAANWTNPIILIYTSEPDAIDFNRSKDYWTHTVIINKPGVKSLTADELNNLVKDPDVDHSTYKLILHAENQGAFGFKSGKSSVLSDHVLSNNTYATETKLILGNEFDGYEWTLEPARDGSGFYLKSGDSYITRGPDFCPNTYWPLVTLTGNGIGIALNAEQCGSQYQMRIKSLDSDNYNCLTCAAGSNKENAIFYMQNNDHTTNFGTWRVYKVSLE